MSHDGDGNDAPDTLDGRAYLDLGRTVFDSVNAALANHFDAYGTGIQYRDIDLVLDNVFGNEDGSVAPTVGPDFVGRRGAARQALETILVRKGIPTSPAARELLRQDAEQDHANRTTHLTTELVKLEHLRDTRMTPREWSKWRRDMNKVEAEIDALPAAEADAIRTEVKRTLADRH